MLTTNFQLTALHMTFLCNLLLHIYHNKMTLSREIIILKEMKNCMIQFKGLSLYF
jgi:hypothetical protein